MIGARSQDEFVAARRPDWQELDRLLIDDSGSLAKKDGAAISRLAALYRSLCTDLMRARAARYTPDLTAYLDALAARAHATLYGAEPFRLPDVVSFFTRDFPRALRDNGRARVVGSRTFGKGSVQTLLPLDNGDSVKLTTARYYTPSGKSIQALGIQPDIVLRPGKDAANGGRAEYSEATLPRHLRGDGEDMAGANAGDVLEGDAPIAAALAELKKPIATTAPIKSPEPKKN